MQAILDTRALTKPPRFSGRDDDWRDWSFQFTSYIGLVSNKMHVQMQACARRTEPLQPMTVLIEQLMMQSRNLYFSLVQLVGGRALAILRAIPDQHGFEAWRRLSMTLHFEPAIATNYLQWKADVHRYQRRSGKELAVETRLQMHIAEYESDYEKVREVLRTFLDSESPRRWGAKLNVPTSSTSTAMPGDSTSME
eukprot:5807951-Amphidinium_carterae.1